MALSHKQARFVTEYLVDLNASAAAERAGYSRKTAAKIGWENLQKPEVRKAIDEALKRRADRVEVKQDDILRELLRLALVDVTEAFDEHGRLKPLKEMSADLRRAIASIEVESVSGEPRITDDGLKMPATSEVRVAKVKFWDKVKGLELLGKHLKLFTDKVEHSGAVSIAVVDPYAEPKRG